MSEATSDLESVILKHALANAIRHNGKAEIGAVVSKTIGEKPDLKGTVGSLIPKIEAIVARINLLSLEQQYSEIGEKFPNTLAELKRPRIEEKKLPALPNAESGRFVVRLPPEPSGFMHIGHAMAGIINQAYALLYDGKIWLRFEDTNPRKVKEEYYQSFRDGYTWLGIKWDHEKNVSDDLQILYVKGERLVSSGHAYACTCQLDEIKRKRFTGTPCSCRAKDVGTNLDAWRRMLVGDYDEGEMVIRLKGDMVSQDPSLRDPSLFRIIDYPHPLQGRKYKVWPVYDFAVVVEDYMCHVTHILRSMEFHVTLQNLLRSLLGFSEITIIQFSRFNFAGTPVSKRLLRPLIEDGSVLGWDDPRMPTISGLKRRGILPQAIREFTLSIGYTRSEHEFEWDLIYAFNRKILDPVTKRYFFIPKPIRLEVENAPKVKVNLRLHPDKDFGVRTIETSGVYYVPADDVGGYRTGDVFRLMELYNVKITEKTESVVKGSFAGGELKEAVPKIQWVTEENLPYTVMIPGPIFVGEQFNKDSLTVVDGLAEKACASLNIGEIIQFTRFGFCRIDGPGKAIFVHK